MILNLAPYIWLLSIALTMGCGGFAFSQEPPEYQWDEAQSFLQSYCVDCHLGEDGEAGLDVAGFDSIESFIANRQQSRKLLRRVRDLEMPPKHSAQPEMAERQQFVVWLKRSLHEAACRDGSLPAPAVTRRLNRDEYANTIRDLLGIHVNVALTLPSDGAGGEGFDNAAETLFLSPIHAEKYLDAARAAMEHAFKDERARTRIGIVQPSESLTTGAAARKTLEGFLPRAFRRPLATDEVDAYLAIFDASLQQTASFPVAMQSTLTAALISPHFLFRIETPNRTSTVEPLDDHELATRLSYFLWASMPDEELMTAADRSKLQDQDELVQQIERMLAGGEVGRSANKVGGFARSFIEQWLGTRALGREFKPDPKVAKQYNSELEGGMKYEPVLFFEEILVKNQSILNCIDADFTYANKSLARHYGLEGEFREQPRRVELPTDTHRGGFLGMASVLAISSYPHRTSPVLRGKWILETMLGAPPAPPPPDVPELEEQVDVEKPQTIRAKLEAHRERSECAVCHDRIDPLGFGLENYDVLGRWRRIQNGRLINSRGKMPDGTEFNGPKELKQVLLSRKDQFAEHLTTKMMGFALGRGLRDEDYCAIEEIVDTLRRSDYASHALVTGIVLSKPFRFKGPEAEGLEPGSANASD